MGPVTETVESLSLRVEEQNMRLGRLELAVTLLISAIGAGVIFRAVKTTLGPKGRNVALRVKPPKGGSN
jgi:hypothetical protein